MLNNVVVTVCLIAISFMSFWIISNVRQSDKMSRNSSEPKNISGTFPVSVLKAWAKIVQLIKMQYYGEDILDDFFAPFFEQSNTIRELSFDGSTVVSTTEPANIQAVLATQFNDFEIGRLRIDQFHPLLGESIFSSNGSSWERARKMFRPPFSRQNINNLASTERATQALIDVIDHGHAGGWTPSVELLPLFNKLTLDTATQFLFGEPLNSQSLTSNGIVSVPDKRAADQARTTQFQRDFELVSLSLVNRVRYQSLYWLVDGIAFRGATKRIRNFAEHFVQKAIRLSESGKPRRTYSLLEALADQTRAKGPQDCRELRNQTLAILAAARDTTAAFLAWCFVRLALHPDIFLELRAVILSTFSGCESVTFSKLKSCRYLQYFLNEVLRLHPPVPVNNRCARVDTTLPVGGGPHQTSPIAIAKGQVVIYSVYLMHRRKDIWGEDAGEFRPQRWQASVPAWHFLPFSGGPRACLGQQFAMTEVGYVLVRMMQQFDAIEPVDLAQMKAMRKELGLTMWPADRVKVRFHRKW